MPLKDFVKLKDFVNKKLTSADKVVSAEGVPLILENCKKYKEMCDLKVYGNSIQEAAEVLFDISNMTLTSGHYLNANGEEVAQGSWSISDYIEVSGYEFTLTNVGGGAPAVCAYDENKNFIKGAIYATGGASVKKDVRITSSNTLIKYIRFSIENTWISDGTINDVRILRHTPTPEAPIEIQSVGELVTDETDANYGKYKIPIVCRGKNLIPFPYANMSVTHNGVTFTVNDDGTVVANGTATGGTAAITIYKLYANNLPVGTYTMSGAPTDDTYMMISSDIASCKGGRSTTFTITSNTYQNMLTCCVINGKTVNNVVFKPMIEAGSQATKYEKYVEPVTTNIFLDEPLRRIGEYADYIDIKNKKVVRQIGECILDGVSADKRVKKVKFHESTGLYYAVYYGVSSFDGSQKVLRNTHFTTEFDPHVKLGTTYIRGAGGTALIMTHTNQKLNTVALWNKWLQEQYNNGTPVKINYVLTTPIEEPPTFYAPNLGLPKLTSKTSIIEVNTDVAPSNISGKYILR